ncbi:hypothetical protein BvCmsKSNP071_02293 [Escherichia coli]|nr:hypothetical protein BvCmsKSNP071_02293 [Escherichia coli]GDL54508.1 hypothetical protein BvCmsKSNP073_00219 [Escherichia coli]
MSGSDGDITAGGFDIPGGINHFSIRGTTDIFLHHQAVTRQHIAVMVPDGAGKQREIIARIQQCGVNDCPGDR